MPRNKAHTSEAQVDIVADVISRMLRAHDEEPSYHTLAPFISVLRLWLDATGYEQMKAGKRKRMRTLKRPARISYPYGPARDAHSNRVRRDAP